MPKIHILPKEVAQLIAAGEVVERPSSVVKELMENAIDAGASNMTLEIQHGGITYIRITDNGCGIAREDIPAAFISHATSKIRQEADLNAIGTLGFRGEALASIAAVSRVELLSCPAEESIGSRCVMMGGEQQSLDDAGCPKGTTIVVRDLFFNTPARMKFLKKDVSEANAVAGVVDRIALSHPEVSVRFIRDGKEALLTPGDGDLMHTIYAVFGKDFSKSLLPVDYTLNGVGVKGYVSKPLASRANRNMQFFFINGRLVKTRTAMAALEQAYKNSVMVGKFPCCVLQLDTPLEQVDVNVHPAKIEVRFANEKPIFDAVYYAVKNTLTREDSPAEMKLRQSPAPVRVFDAPTAGEGEQTVLKQPSPQQKAAFWGETPTRPKAAAQLHQPAPVYHTASPRRETKDDAKLAQKITEILAETAAEVAGFTPVEEKTPPPAAPIPAAEPCLAEPEPDENPIPANPAPVPQPEIQVLGEAFQTYIFAQSGGELLIIDKHAAHERILFEELKAQKEGSSQLLLQPEAVTMSKEEYNVVLDHLDLLRQAGFLIEDFGAGTLLVRECPMVMVDMDMGAVLAEIAGHLLAHKSDILPEKLDWLYHNVACRAAIKGGDTTSPYERERFVRRLLSMSEIRYCPHGRPVMMVMTRRELEKQFGRTE